MSKVQIEVVFYFKLFFVFILFHFFILPLIIIIIFYNNYNNEEKTFSFSDSHSQATLDNVLSQISKRKTSGQLPPTAATSAQLPPTAGTSIVRDVIRPSADKRE